MKSSRLRIIVTGLIAQHPTLGGVAWDYLQYAVGLARLGHDVYYFEDSGEWPYTLDGGPTGNDWVRRDPTPNLEHLASVLSRYDLGHRWAYRFPLQSQWFGLSESHRREVLETADLLINVSGTLERPWFYRQIPRLIYIDSDPVFTQTKLRLPDYPPEFRERFETHDVFFTFGDCIPENYPDTHWLTTRQPIVLSEWNPSAERREVYTTVMSWTSYEPLRLGQQSFGQKDVEMKRFLELPSMVAPAVLEAAIGGSMQHLGWRTENSELPPRIARLFELEPDLTPRMLLERTGWRFVSPADVCGDVDSYRHYIQSSKAEWSVAKNGYVAGQSGWFSCRSACYLAAGRPVVVQDTGFRLPAGEGILSFSTLEQAAEAILEVEAHYTRHANAAREIAWEYFDAAKVLGELIEKATRAHPQPGGIAA